MRVLPTLAYRDRAGKAPFVFWNEGKRAQYALSIFRCYQASIFVSRLGTLQAQTLDTTIGGDAANAVYTDAKAAAAAAASHSASAVTAAAAAAYAAARGATRRLSL